MGVVMGLSRKTGIAAWLFYLFFCGALPASAAPLLDIAWGPFPFGPFLANQTVVVSGTATNNTLGALTICEGVCIGDVSTISMGALASIPVGYSFAFGNGGDTSAGFLNGQLAGLIAPGETKNFIFGQFFPDATVSPGSYGFFTQLQFFEATDARPMTGTSSFGGTWQVVTDVPEPPTVAMMLFTLGILGATGWWRRKSLAAMGTLRAGRLNGPCKPI